MHFIEFNLLVILCRCGHCQRLAPTWAQLEELLNVEGSRVTIASVDCTQEKDLCAEQDITGLNICIQVLISVCITLAV